MSDRLVSMYFDIRERVAGAAVLLDERALAARVPACPDWTVHQLVVHLVSMPMAIIAGDVPETVMAGGDPNPWLRGLVDEHADRSIGDLARWWASEDAALAELLPRRSGSRRSFHGFLSSPRHASKSSWKAGSRNSR